MKIRIKFSKQGNMRFIGHLDIMRYFQKAMRRADVDIRYSEGFSPHQIMSFAAPLGVGLTGSGEYLDIEVLSTESSGRLVERLNAQFAGDGGTAPVAQRGGIALRNVNSRIRLMFGEDYGLHLFSAVDVGTECCVTLPLRFGEA